MIVIDANILIYAHVQSFSQRNLRATGSTSSLMVRHALAALGQLDGFPAPGH